MGSKDSAAHPRTTSGGDERPSSPRPSSAFCSLRSQILLLAVVCAVVLISTVCLHLFLAASDAFEPPRVASKPPIWDERTWPTAEEVASNLTERLVFKRPPGTEHLRCDRMFANDLTYLAEYAERRVASKDPEQLDTSCAAIRSRHFFPQAPRSEAEARFPIAHARVVYKMSSRKERVDYIQLELELAATYAPQNLFCYVLGSGTTAAFRERMTALAACFPNVHVAGEVDVKSSGHGMMEATLKCLHWLAEERRRHHWKYVFVLQNHDTTTRNNAEVVQILHWLNGANDVEINPQMANFRNSSSIDWSFKGLGLFKNPEKNSRLFKGALPQLTLAKGYSTVALRREMVDFVLSELNLTRLLQVLAPEDAYGVDEYLWPSLHVTPALEVPGGMTSRCVRHGWTNPFATRYAKWDTACLSGYARHSICVMGAEDLRPTVLPLRELFVNKFLPQFDFGAAVCWYERLFNRTYGDAPGRPEDRLDRRFYESLPHVRYQRLKDRKGHVSSKKAARFACHVPPAGAKASGGN